MDPAGAPGAREPPTAPPRPGRELRPRARRAAGRRHRDERGVRGRRVVDAPHRGDSPPAGRPAPPPSPPVMARSATAHGPTLATVPRCRTGLVAGGAGQVRTVH